jgi:polysaccharide export outer membrane protein
MKVFNICGIYRKTILLSASVLIFSFNSTAQTENPTVKIAKAVQTENNPAVETPKVEPKATDTPKIADTPANPEEAEILPYYNNYLNEYRLGPNDVITVEVFGQCPDYCKSNITVPPTARISYPLIREGVLVGGKTVEQIADEITKKLDEYIIDPKVTVTLDKAMSARYSVLGKVAAPGVRVLDRKVSVYEAIVESGGVLKEGDKKRVVVYSYDGQGRITPRIINLQEIERGKGEMVFLNPGDQVFVPDQGFKLNVNTILKVLEKASIVRLLFGSPF